MIRVRQDGEVRECSYQEFIRDIQDGRVKADTLVWSDVLTSGVWKPAGELQFFRSWAPRGTFPAPAERPAEPLPREDAQPASQPPPLATPPPPFSEYTAAPWYPPPAPEADPLPWEEIERLGFLRGFGRTIGLALSDAQEFCSRIGRRDTFTPALAFGLFMTLLSGLVSSLYQVATWRLLGPLYSQMASQMPQLQEEFKQPGLRDTIFAVGVGVLLYPIGVFVLSAAIHALLRLSGRTEGRFRGTFRVLNFATAPYVLVILPVCGQLIGVIWAVVLSIMGLMRVHRVSGFRATIAVLLPLLFFGFWVAAAILQRMGGALPHLGGAA